MCEICHQVPCRSQCPNAPEPPSPFDCDFCGDPIRIGDTYLNEGGKHICEGCLDNMTVSELIYEIELSLIEADEDDLPEPDYDLIRKDEM